MDDLINTLREIGFSVFTEEDLTTNDVCMNPHATTCDTCPFDKRTYRSGEPWCKPEEREAKHQSA